MKLRLRRILTIIISAIYIVVVLILLTYAAGWRFDSSTKSFDQVGAIYIDTKPSNALVTVNEKLLKKDTPLTIKNLFPDNYTVEINKKDYYPWSSPVRVESAKTSRLIDITLIKKNTPHVLPYSNIDNVKLSSDNNYATLISSDRLTVVNLEQDDIKEQFDFKIIPESVAWSPLSDKIIVQISNKDLLLIDANDQGNILLLKEMFARDFTYAIWSHDETDVLYASDGNDMYRLNIFQETSTKLFDHRDITFASTDFLMQKKGGDLVMIDNYGKPIKDLKIPNTSNIIVTPLSGRIILLRDTVNELGYLFDKQNLVIQKLDFPIRNTGSIHNDHLLVHNGYEIISWDWKTNTQILLLRTSEIVSQADWLLSGKYVIFIQNGSVRIIESTTLNQNSYIVPFAEAVSLSVQKNSDSIIVQSEDLLYSVSF